jgi:hypothetical protein
MFKPIGVSHCRCGSLTIAFSQPVQAQGPSGHRTGVVKTKAAHWSPSVCKL